MHTDDTRRLFPRDTRIVGVLGHIVHDVKRVAGISQGHWNRRRDKVFQLRRHDAAGLVRLKRYRVRTGRARNCAHDNASRFRGFDPREDKAIRTGRAKMLCDRVIKVVDWNGNEGLGEADDVEDVAPLLERGECTIFTTIQDGVGVQTKRPRRFGKVLCHWRLQDGSRLPRLRIAY